MLDHMTQMSQWKSHRLLIIALRSLHFIMSLLLAPSILVKGALEHLYTVCYTWKISYNSSSSVQNNFQPMFICDWQLG